MTVLLVAVDVVREAFARRIMMALFGAIVLFLALLAFALDLEVVEGALAAGKLFGKSIASPIIPIDVAMRTVFEVLTFVVFYLGLLFGIVSMADIAPKLLAPGRVELLLSLPVRRYELVVGTYLGVASICLMTTAFAVGGISGVLFYKAELFTLAPLMGSLAAVLAFLPLYAAMLFVSALARSAPLAAGVGMSLFFAGIITSDRARFLGFIKAGLTRDVVAVVIAPLPRIGALADAGMAAATEKPIDWAVLGPVVLGVVLFAATFVVLAAFVVSGKDY